MFNRTRFEHEMTALREYDVPPSGPGGKTHYLPIDLNTALKGKKMGAYVPGAAATAKIVDVIVYFHGVIGVCGSESTYISKGVEYLWSTAPFGNMRSELEASGRSAVLLVPRLDSRVGKTGTGPTQYGDLNKDKAFDNLINKALAELKSTTLKAVRDDVTLGNIVLAAHSGGGSPMYAILAAKNDHRPKIRACWGFECLYPGYKKWVEWLKEDAKFRFRHFRQECVFTTEAWKIHEGAGDTRWIDTQLAPASDAHCKLIQNYWKTVIGHMPMTPGTNSAY
jgi:hypothetical protein